jgi:dTDP-glucose 4,6-dehydratase
LKSLEYIENNARYAFEQVDVCNAADIKRVLNKYQPDNVMHSITTEQYPTPAKGPLCTTVNLNKIRVFLILNLLIDIMF